MRQVLFALLLTAAVSGTSASGQAPQPGIDNAVAFARLYGVVRYFYPSDAAAGLDWNRFAIHGAKEVRGVNKIIGPYGESAGWESFGWNLEPRSPRVGGRIVFLTDGRAISYAESVLGYVADRKLGTIVGGATAGANGNVAAFVVPGGFRILFTGMRVTGHDGRTPHHLVGVKPDVPMAPTLAGLRAGRDDVLEHAVALIRGQ